MAPGPAVRADRPAPAAPAAHPAWALRGRHPRAAAGLRSSDTDLVAISVGAAARTEGMLCTFGHWKYLFVLLRRTQDHRVRRVKRDGVRKHGQQIAHLFRGQAWAGRCELRLKLITAQTGLNNRDLSRHDGATTTKRQRAPSHRFTAQDTEKASIPLHYCRCGCLAAGQARAKAFPEGDVIQRRLLIPCATTSCKSPTRTPRSPPANFACQSPTPTCPPAIVTVM